MASRKEWFGIERETEKEKKYLAEERAGEKEEKEAKYGGASWHILSTIGMMTEDPADCAVLPATESPLSPPPSTTTITTDNHSIYSLIAMTNPSQLFLLADHIKLSLLERQRAISLNLEPNSQDGEISRSLESLREGIESVEANLPDSDDHLKDQLDQLHLQYRDMTLQFDGGDNTNNPTTTTTATGPAETSRPDSSSPDLKQPVPQHPPSKSVRFMDSSADMDDDPNRQNLFQPYRDSPSPPLDQSGLSNEQIYAGHNQVMRDQDDQLDRLGESIGRQHQLSIQIGDELEGHVALLDGMDGDVERHQTRLDRAKRRLNKIRRAASDNMSMMTIIGLIIVLVILIVILK